MSTWGCESLLQENFGENQKEIWIQSSCNNGNARAVAEVLETVHHIEWATEKCSIARRKLTDSYQGKGDHGCYERL